MRWTLNIGHLCRLHCPKMTTAPGWTLILMIRAIGLA